MTTKPVNLQTLDAEIERLENEKFNHGLSLKAEFYLAALEKLFSIMPVDDTGGQQQKRVVVLKGGSLKSDGNFWYKATTVAEIMREIGVEIVE